MAPPLEGGAAKDVDELLGDAGAEDPRSEAEDVGVVVEAGHLGGVGVMAQSGPDAGMAVGRHRHADAGTADEDSLLGCSGRHLPGQQMGEIGVVDRGAVMGAEVFYGQNNHKTEVALENDKTSPYGAMAVVDYGFKTGGKLMPYVFGGLGVLIHRFSSTELSASETQFGYEVGAGVDFGVSPKVGIFVEGRYMGSSDTQFFAADAGLAFNLKGGS